MLLRTQHKAWIHAAATAAVAVNGAVLQTSASEWRSRVLEYEPDWSKLPAATPLAIARPEIGRAHV